MDDLTKELSAEMERDLAHTNLASAKLKTNGGPLTAKTPRMAELIDRLITDHQTHIDVLKRLKESL